MTDPDSIDRSALDNLLAMTGGDPAFLAEMIDSFIDDAADQLAAMDQSLQASDQQVLRRSAHTLKSTCASFGAQSLGAVCREIEARAASGAFSGVDGLLRQAHDEFERARAALLVARPSG